jgi:hypothetical protein
VVKAVRLIFARKQAPELLEEHAFAAAEEIDVL